MGDTGVRRSILDALSNDPVLGGLYTASNTALVGTHSHSGVGGYLEDLLPQITSLGYVSQTAQAIVDGTLNAIRKAHASLATGYISVGNTTLLGANRNRSPSAYQANPAEEIARYQYDQDKELSALRLVDENGNARGVISFFAVHGTSLYEVSWDISITKQGYHGAILTDKQNNTLVSGDNKGMASYMYECERHAPLQYDLQSTSLCLSGVIASIHPTRKRNSQHMSSQTRLPETTASWLASFNVCPLLYTLSFIVFVCSGPPLDFAFEPSVFMIGTHANDYFLPH